MSRTQQDQFIDDDEEETCPLCVEELDLTDQGFRPCPCGYQICQFCYNNVKNNMNGLCPACRRPYEEKNIEYKVATQEELAAHRARQAQKQKKTQAAMQKERQKAEADHLSRRHLAGLRVVQKNLVYVTGLSPTTQEDKLLQTLRGDQYFGQYGRIIKIVVSKARDPAHPNSVGVYVTYERKEDAAACIDAVNGSKNGDRTLRAQFGTTKYCSAYLRNEQCTNRNCMFLHEPGEANESYSRADLSALNAESSQQGGGRPPPQSQQPIASAAPPPAPAPALGDFPGLTPSRPALPSTASWASRPLHTAPARPESRATAVSVESPAISHASPVQTTSVPSMPETKLPVRSSKKITTKATASVPPQAPPEPRRRTSSLSPLEEYIKGWDPKYLAFTFDPSGISAGDWQLVQNMPPLFDVTIAARFKLRRQREAEQRQRDQELMLVATRQAEVDGIPREGSSQLESDADGHDPDQLSGADGLLDQRFRFGDGPLNVASGDSGPTSQSHQQLLLQTIKGGSELGGNLTQSPTFPNSLSTNNISAPPGHQRNVSRYSFQKDATSAPHNTSNQLNTPASSALGSQYNNIQDPKNGGAQQFFTNNVQGPPPGLRATGTPPVSGGMTFGQGHGFTTGGLPYGASANRHNDDNIRILRGPAAEAAAKRESNLNLSNHYSTLSQYPSTHVNAFAGQAYNFDGVDKQRNKKKNKKHGRHANTSSSVSSGPDIAGSVDQHLLQGRAHPISNGLGFAGHAANSVNSLYFSNGLHNNNSYNSRW